MVFEGHGLAHGDGKTVFVENGLPGETVEASVVRTRKGVVFARATDILEPSAARRVPPCPAYGRCGGCQLQHASYELQLEAKRQFVREALRILGPSAPEVPPVTPSPEPFGFRNHMSFTLRRDGARMMAGLHARGSETELADASDCRIAPAVFREALALALDRLNSPGRPRGRDPHRLALRLGRATGGKLAVLSSPGADDLSGSIADALAAAGWGVAHRRGEDRRGPERGRCTVLREPGVIVERLSGCDYEIGPDTFFQTNTAQAENLLNWIADAVERVGARHIADLYAGTGLFAVRLAASSTRIDAVESNPDSVGAGRRNAARNRAGHIRWHGMEAEQFVARLVEKPDAVIVDPPRSGLSDPIRRALVDRKPAALFHVSCHPATLARDLAVFTRAGYRVRALQCFDMFPQSYHVETAAWLE